MLIKKHIKVLLLGGDNPDSRKLKEYLIHDKNNVMFMVGKVSLDELKRFLPDIIISYGYRFILGKEIFSFPMLGTINLHISYLPWNKGADPNFWSHIERTPKGVTIHYINEGIDTGDIIAQRIVVFFEDDTLKTSYVQLQVAIQNLFLKYWPSIKNGDSPRIKQVGKGSFHLSRDKDVFGFLLADLGWDTPIKKLEEYGGKN